MLVGRNGAAKTETSCETQAEGALEGTAHARTDRNIVQERSCERRRTLTNYSATVTDRKVPRPTEERCRHQSLQSPSSSSSSGRSSPRRRGRQIQRNRKDLNNTGRGYYESRSALRRRRRRRRRRTQGKRKVKRMMGGGRCGATFASESPGHIEMRRRNAILSGAYVTLARGRELCTIRGGRVQ